MNRATKYARLQAELERIVALGGYPAAWRDEEWSSDRRLKLKVETQYHAARGIYRTTVTEQHKHRTFRFYFDETDLGDLESKLFDALNRAARQIAARS